MSQYREESHFCTRVLLNLEFLLIIYESRRVGEKVLLKLNVNDVGDEKHPYTVMHLL